MGMRETVCPDNSAAVPVAGGFRAGDWVEHGLHGQLLSMPRQTVLGVVSYQQHWKSKPGRHKGLFPSYDLAQPCRGLSDQKTPAEVVTSHAHSQGETLSDLIHSSAGTESQG